MTIEYGKEPEQPEGVLEYGASNVQGTTLDYGTAKARVEKYSKAMGTIREDEKEGLVSSVQAGKDDEVRESLSIKMSEQDMAMKKTEFLKLLYDGNTDIETAQKLLTPKEVGTKDINSFLEKAYSTNLITEAFSSKEEGNTLPQDDFSKANILRATDLVATREVALRFKEQMEHKVREMGTVPFVGEIAMSVVPFGMSYIQGKKSAINSPDDLLLGQNLQEQFDEIWALPPEKAALKIKQRVEEISAISNTAALDWLDRLISGGSTERYMDNVFSGLDATLLSPLAKGAVKGTSLTGQAARNFVGAITSPGSNSLTATVAAGNLAHAARMNAMNKLFTSVTTEIPARGSFFPWMQDLATIINPQQVLTGGANGLSANATARIMLNLEANAAKAIDYIVDGMRNTERLEGNVLQEAVDQARNNAALQYPGINNQIIGVSHEFSTIGNNFNAAIMIGNTQADLFTTALEAENMAKYFLFLKEYQIEQVGSKFGIKILKPLDETSDAVRDALRFHIQTNDQTPTSYANAFLNYLRSNDNTLAQGTNTDLKKAVYGAVNVQELMRALAKPLKLKKDEGQEFLAFVDRQKLYVDPVNGNTGRFSRDANELDQEWWSMYGKSPTEKQYEAYFSYRQMNDVDYMIRNINIYRDKVRTGIQNFSFNFDGLKWKQGKVPHIEGKFVQELPWHLRDDRPFGMLWIDETGRVERHTSSERVYRQTQALLQSGNYKIINLTRFGEDTLRATPVAGGRLPVGPLDYVIVHNSNNLRTANLDLRQIPYREGYHVAIDDGTFMVRQPHMRQEGNRHIYYGDRNIIQARTERQARDYAQRFEAVRPIVRDVINGNRPASDLTNAIRTHNIPFSTQEVIVTFRTHLDVDQPIMWSRKGQNLEDAHKISSGYIGRNFTKHSEDPHNPLRGVDLAFAMERNEPINQVRQVGVNGGAPVWNVEPGKYLDPMGVIERSTEKLIKDVVLKDMRINASERFLAEFGDVLEGTLQDLRRNPLGVLENPVWKKNADSTRVIAAKNFQRATLEFMQIKGDHEKTVERLHQRLADSIFERFGDRGVSVLGNIEKHIPTNPIRFLRAASVNLKFGFFNPGQLFMQAQGVVHIAGIEGIDRAVHASGAFTLMKYGNGNMDARLLTTLGDRAQAMGWGQRAHFEEMYREAYNSGFVKLGGSYSGVENYLTADLFTSTMGTALDHSKVFFKTGEEFVRGAAYSAAYRRWREANPNAPFTRIAQDTVLRRADLLSVHMSSASNAQWNKGFSSIPTQFMSYQARLMEQIWGGELTRMEKAHMLGLYSAVYGVPVGVGGALLGGVWPVHETIKQYAIENGIDFDSNIVFKSFNDGLGSLITEYLVGSKQNVNERFGPGGNSMFRDLYNNARGVGRKTFGETLAGAGGNTVYNVIKSTHPLFYSFYRTTTGSDPWPLQQEDFLDFTKEISSANNAIKAFYAISLGTYFTRQNTRIIKDASVIEGIMTGLLGTVPERVDNYYNVMLSSSELKLAKENAAKNASLYYNRAMEAFRKEDDEAGVKFLKKTQIYMTGLDVSEQAKVFSQAVSKDINGLEEAEFKYAQKNPKYWDMFIKKHERTK
jgi:hypothetical protein